MKLLKAVLGGFMEAVPPKKMAKAAEHIVGRLMICFPLGAWLWTYSINTWLVFADKEPVFPWWVGGLICMIPRFDIVLTFSCAGVAIGTLITMLFLA